MIDRQTIIILGGDDDDESFIVALTTLAAIMAHLDLHGFRLTREAYAFAANQTEPPIDFKQGVFTRNPNFDWAEFTRLVRQTSGLGYPNVGINPVEPEQPSDESV
jgi:hypothetical protein